MWAGVGTVSTSDAAEATVSYSSLQLQSHAACVTINMCSAPTYLSIGLLKSKFFCINPITSHLLLTEARFIVN